MTILLVVFGCLIVFVASAALDENPMNATYWLLWGSGVLLFVGGALLAVVQEIRSHRRRSPGSRRG